MKHRRFKKVDFDNKKKVFHLLYISGLEIECPYSALGIREKVIEAGPDQEVSGYSFYFVLEGGEKNFVPFDQPLHIAQHPEYVRETVLYEITKQINCFIDQEQVSKRELSRRLRTSMSQLARLLDTTNYKKEFSRLIELAAILNYEFKWKFKKAA
ncbi:MAG: hypothetical protein HYS07_05895 [Chlamydiae bacterium]|nr:hypothetical protein [Chlamydiota bacterium]MBI3277262.1 hypothetical protein [Chlamydiota bacterium]